MKNVNGHTICGNKQLLTVTIIQSLKIKIHLSICKKTYNTENINPMGFLKILSIF